MLSPEQVETMLPCVWNGQEGPRCGSCTHCRIATGIYELFREIAHLRLGYDASQIIEPPRFPPQRPWADTPKGVYDGLEAQRVAKSWGIKDISEVVQARMGRCPIVEFTDRHTECVACGDYNMALED